MKLVASGSFKIKRSNIKILQHKCQYNVYISGPSNRSPLEAFAGFKVAGGDLLEGAGICQYIRILNTVFWWTMFFIDPRFFVRLRFPSTLVCVLFFLGGSQQLYIPRRE